MVVRLPAQILDTKLIRDLAQVGSLKSQKIGSQDVSKQYTDTESRLRAPKPWRSLDQPY